MIIIIITTTTTTTTTATTTATTTTLAAATATPGAALVAGAAVYGGVDISSCASCCNLGSILSTVRVQFAAAAQLLLPQWPLLLTLSLVPHGRFLGSPAGPTDGRKLGADTIAVQGKARANPQNEVRCDTFMIIYPGWRPGHVTVVFCGARCSHRPSSQAKRFHLAYGAYWPTELLNFPCG